MSKIMYITEISKFGIKEIFVSPIIAKIHRQMSKILEQYEIGITKKDIKNKSTLGTKLRKLKDNETVRIVYNNTNVRITKTKLLTK